MSLMNAVAGLATADFDGDGKLDLAVAQPLASSVAIWAGKGDGTFKASGQLALAVTGGGGPVALDLNGDGKLDIAIALGAAKQSNGGVAVFLSGGNGTFAPARYYATDSSSIALAAADWNGDGTVDLAALSGGPNGLANELVVLLNRKGTLQSAEMFDLDLLGRGYVDRNGVVIDLNGDGKADLVAGVGSGGVEVALGVGDGTLQARTLYGNGGGRGAAAVGDFSGDGKPDVLSIDQANRLLFYTNKGDGTGALLAPTSLAVGVAPMFVIAADLNGDGKLDAATANSGANDVSVVYGNGDGSFKPQVKFDVSDFPWAIAAGDMNGDRLLDLVTANAGGVTVILNDGAGGFQPAIHQSFGNGSTYAHVALGDLDGDGKLDVVTAAAGGGGGVTIYLGKGDGSLRSPTNIPLPAVDIALADLNRDGALDIAVKPGLNVLLGDGKGGFCAPRFFSASPITSGGIATGDLNGDGKIDLVAFSVGEVILLNTTN